MKVFKCILPKYHNYGGNLNQDWYAYYSYRNPETDRMQRIKVYKGINVFNTVNERTEAAKALCKSLEAKLHGGYNPFERKDVIYDNQLIYDKDEWKGRKTVKDYSVEYYLSKVIENKKKLVPRGNMSEKTIGAYLTKARSFTAFINAQKWRNIPINAIQKEHCEKYLESIWSHINHNCTWNMYLSIMQMFWNELKEMYPALIMQNPWSRIKPLEYESTSLNAFNATQTEKIKQHLQKTDSYMLMICEVVYYCFIRCCKELTRLQVKDINFEHKCIIVPWTIAKNKKTRPIKVPHQLMEKFIQLRLWEYPENYFLFTRFMEPKEMRSGRDYFSKRFKKNVMIPLGFGKGYSLYSWKHTGNSKLAHTNIPPKFAQLQNRHHSLEQTERYQQSFKLDESEILYLGFPTM